MNLREWCKTILPMSCQYRVKPSPKLRPWTVDEAQDHVGCQMRSKHGKVMLLTASVGVGESTLNEWLENWLWRWPNDPDTVWKPCGVEVEDK